MKIELTEDEIILINDLLVQEIFNTGKLQYQKFIDRKEVLKHLEEVKTLLHKMPSID